MHHLTFITCLGIVSALPSNPLVQDEDICATAGKLCGKNVCVPHQEKKFFTCQCKEDQYFDATAQRCYHIKSCGPYPCHSGTCEDSDGNAERTCRCLNFQNMTPNCRLDQAFKDSCYQSGGEIESIKNGARCRCPDLMKWDGTKCISTACTFSHLTCANICENKRLMEDKRCCQGWDTSSCSALHDANTYCEPGTISTGETLNCTNACAAKKSECEYPCEYTDVKSPEYTCLCPPGKRLNSDERTCSVKMSCDMDEEKVCSDEGKKCVFEEGKAECKCYGNTVEIGGICAAECSAEKAKECTGLLSTCKIAKNEQTCVCEQPLTWDSTKKACVLDNQFRYTITFKQYRFGTQDACSDVHREDLALTIDKAMKTLYGKELSATRLIECRDEQTVELTFKSEPLPPTLNRIYQCENKKDGHCLIGPHLQLIDGSVSGPTPLDLCTEFLTRTPVISKNGLKCRKEEDGTYSLRCAQSSSAPSEKYGVLTVQLCSSESKDDKSSGSAAASVSAALFFGILVPALFA